MPPFRCSRRRSLPHRPQPRPPRRRRFDSHAAHPRVRARRRAQDRHRHVPPGGGDYQHQRRAHPRTRRARPVPDRPRFGATAMAGAYAGGQVAHFLPASVLLTTFAAVMLVTSAAMMRGRRAPRPAGVPAEPEVAKVLAHRRRRGHRRRLDWRRRGFLDRARARALRRPRHAGGRRHLADGDRHVVVCRLRRPRGARAPRCEVDGGRLRVRRRRQSGRHAAWPRPVARSPALRLRLVRPGDGPIPADQAAPRRRAGVRHGSPRRHHGGVRRRRDPRALHPPPGQEREHGLALADPSTDLSPEPLPR